MKPTTKELEDMDVKRAMIAWSLDGGVKVGPHPDTTRWSDGYDFTVGACFTGREDWNEDTRSLQMFIDFHSMVARGHRCS